MYQLDQNNLLVSGTQVTETDGLLWGQVDHNETIDTDLLAVLEQTLVAVLHDWVIVAHEHDGALQATATGDTDEIENLSNGDTILKGLGVGLLDSRAIGNGVSERNAEFDDVYVGNWTVSRMNSTPPLGGMMDSNSPAPPFSMPRRTSTASLTVG